MSKAKRYLLTNNTGTKQVLSGVARLRPGESATIDEPLVAQFSTPDAKAAGWKITVINETGASDAVTKQAKTKKSKDGGNGDGRIQ